MQVYALQQLTQGAMPGCHADATRDASAQRASGRVRQHLVDQRLVTELSPLRFLRNRSGISIPPDWLRSSLRSEVVIEVPLRDGLALALRRILISAEVDSAVDAGVGHGLHDVKQIVVSEDDARHARMRVDDRVVPAVGLPEDAAGCSRAGAVCGRVAWEARRDDE